jgi:Ets-domain
VSREEGIFRIINTDLLARMWGRRHGNPCMTYEKLARAMRLALKINYQSNAYLINSGGT